ncbi:MAG: pentapeptide repeat-containing protein [Nostoc sp.]|uniref:pentapeptide repeat-containing protein n=1 Tax=Nostoc sp. TaxID=1180 RepID=UPI002FF86CAF
MLSNPSELVAKLLDIDEREFWRVCLPGAQLQGKDLSGVDWYGGNMSKACLDGANLQKAVLFQCKLTEASFKGALLTQACFRAADLRGAFFQGADLREADFVNANLTNANLAGADLRGADLSGAKLNEANLCGAILDGAKIPGKVVNNQGIPFNPTWRIYHWEGLRFRSKNEIEIAKALDEAGVLFLPLCLARLNTPTGRRNLEPDFLVCHHGKWGLMEVDGPYHTPLTRVDEQERERFFQHHGIRVIQRFDAKSCEDKPHEVVREFLQLIEKMH